MPLSAEQSARVFRERAQRARQAREQHAARLRVEVATQVRELLPASGRAWLIGSLAWGGFGERSDIDLVLAGVTGADATRIEDAVARAAQVPVDVLDFDALPRAFQERVVREGLSLP